MSTIPRQPRLSAPFLRLQRTLRGNMPALDGIRGAAILLVLAHQFILDGPIRSSIGKAIHSRHPDSDNRQEPSDEIGP